MSETTAVRWGAIAGIAFVLLFVVGVIFIGDTPDTDATPTEIADFYDDNANQWRIILGFYLWVLAALAFIWFVASLRTSLRPAFEGSRTTAFLTLVAGLTFPVMLMLGAAAIAAVSGAIVFGEVPTQSLGMDPAWLFPQLGFAVILIPGALAAAAFVALVTMAGGQAGLLPGWLLVLGGVAAVLLILSPFFFPMAALPIWVLAASIVLLRRQSAAA